VSLAKQGGTDAHGRPVSRCVAALRRRDHAYAVPEMSGDAGSRCLAVPQGLFTHHRVMSEWILLIYPFVLFACVLLAARWQPKS
jgi:hypothetical protein